MTENQGLLEHWKIALDDVQVGAANAACEHTQQNVARGHLRARHILNS
jgi:hypothetical protein